MKTNKSLKTLEVWGCGIGREGITSIANSLVENQSLQNLNIRGNIFTKTQKGQIVDQDKPMDGVTSLAKGIAANKTLVNIDLGGNRLTFLEAYMLASKLKESQSLVNLNLGGANLADEGLKSAAELLENNHTLTVRTKKKKLKKMKLIDFNFQKNRV